MRRPHGRRRGAVLSRQDALGVRNHHESRALVVVARETSWSGRHARYLHFYNLCLRSPPGGPTLSQKT